VSAEVELLPIEKAAGVFDGTCVVVIDKPGLCHARLKPRVLAVLTSLDNSTTRQQTKLIYTAVTLAILNVQVINWPSSLLAPW
jgi:hypothetical protein